MNSNISIFLFFTCFAFQINGFSQNFQGIYQSIDLDNPLVLSVSEQGELLMGKLYRSDLSSKEFVGRKSKYGFAGVFEVEGEVEEVHGVITKKSLTLTLKAENKTVEMERLSKDLNYDFSKVFGEATKELKDKVTGVWILKEQYKIENGEKAYSELTGKDYMTAFNPDGMYVLDVRGFRDADKEMAKEINSPAHLRLKASDYFEMSQMLSWKVVGRNIHISPRIAVPGFSEIMTVYGVSFDDGRMILKNLEHGWIEIYEPKR